MSKCIIFRVLIQMTHC